MGRERKKTAIHPGSRTCDPCHICDQRRTQHCPTATWDNEMKEKFEEISEVMRATDQGGGVKIRKIMDSAGAVLHHALN